MALARMFVVWTPWSPLLGRGVCVCLRVCVSVCLCVCVRVCVCVCVCVAPLNLATGRIYLSCQNRNSFAQIGPHCVPKSPENFFGPHLSWRGSSCPDLLYPNLSRVLRVLR
jgi:hypothetical protein